MRTLRNSSLALLLWLIMGTIIELIRVPRYGTAYLFGLALDLLLVVFACVLSFFVWTRSRYAARTYPTASKVLIAFTVPFFVGLPIVVAGNGETLYRQWDFYKFLFFDGTDWIIIGVHVFATLLIASVFFLCLNRRSKRTFEIPPTPCAPVLSRFLIVGVVLIADLFLAQQYALAISRGRPNNSLMKEIAAGTPVEEFALTDIDGLEIRHNAQTDHVLLVAFFATWCGPCCEELPYLEKLWKANRANSRFTMVVIGVTEEEDTLKKFREENGCTMRFAADKDGSLFKRFGADGVIPSTCLLQNGTVQISIRGFHPDRLKQLEEVLALQ